MDITQDNYDKIKTICNNEIAFDKTYKMLETFVEEYKTFIAKFDTSEILDKTKFKKDSTLVFELLRYVFQTELDELDEEDSDYEEDHGKFGRMCDNLHCILDTLDTIDTITTTDCTLICSLSYVFNYFENCKPYLNNENNSTEKQVYNLEKVSESLLVFTKLSEITENLVTGNDISNEILTEYSKYTKELLQTYNKDSVLIVIKDLHENKDVDYKKDYENELDDTLKKKYIELVQINTVLTLQLSIQSRINKIS
jgi:hypothetical protein|uniref:Uncharacterized protein n=1 Tax=viral metagenome TaxID=1070528 RepID=A0A6C0IX37_9ZZZZ